MNTVARWHVICGLVLAIAGMVMGMHMAASHDHGQHATHAHLMLLGLVVSLLYAMLYRLWVADGPTLLAWTQLVMHQAGTVVLVAGLYALYGGLLAPQALEPVLGVASVSVLLGLLTMLLLFVRATRAAAAPAGRRKAQLG